MGQSSSSQKASTGPREAWAADSAGVSTLHGTAGYGGGNAMLEYGVQGVAEPESDSDVEGEHDSSLSFGASHRLTALEIATAGPGRLLHPTVEASAPAWAADEPVPHPPGELSLAFAYGYTPASAGSNLHALPSGELAYPCGRHLILYDASLHRQRFLSAHDAPVRAVAKHPYGDVLATGQAAGGAAPIAVWRVDRSSSAAEPLVLLGDGVAGGVSGLAFSSDGQTLAALFSDADRTLVLYDWRGARPLGSAATGPGGPAFGLAFSLTPDATLAVAAARRVRLWRLGTGGGALSSAACELPVAEGTRAATVTALAWHPHGTLLGGSSRGHILVWHGTALLRQYHAHAGPVFGLELPRGAPAANAFVLSGGKDGKLKLWGTDAFSVTGDAPADRQELRVVDLRGLSSRLTDGAGRPQLLGPPCVRALSWHGTRVLVGTKAGEVLQLDYSASEDAPETTLLLQGHAIQAPAHSAGGWAGSSAAPAAVAAHPSEPLFASAAADASVRLWSTRDRAMLAMRALPAPPTALAFSPLADILAVAVAGGAVLALAADSLAERGVAQLDAQAEGTPRCLAFSPDGATLAVGTDAGPIVLYHQARGSLERVGVLRGHTAPVVSIDWSESGGELQSNSATHELLFWQARSCGQLAAASTRSLRWASASCRAAWPLLGAVARAAHPDCLTASCRTRGGEAVAVGHSDGGISLHPYPCASHLTPARLVDGAHADGTVGLGWASDDATLLSIGEDGCVLQWAYGGAGPAGASDAVGAAAAALEEAELDSEVEAELAREIHPALLPAGSRAAAAANKAAGWVTAMSSGVAPFWGELHAPSGWAAPLDALTPPSDGLALEWVYGLRSHDARGHAYWTAGGEAVFPAAGVGVVLDPKARSQRFCMSHSAEVLCVAIHPNRLLAATGQGAAASAGAALVWDTRTGDTLAVLRGVHREGVACLAFDGSGALLATCGLEPSHMVALWDWQSEASLLARVATGAPRVFGLAFRPAGGRLELAAAGVRSLTFICESTAAAAPLLLRCRRGTWGRAAPPSTLLCVAWSRDGAECLTGTVRGDVLLWCERTLLHAVRAHAGPVHALCPSNLPGDATVISAGRGGKLRRWGAGLKPAGAAIDLRPHLAALSDGAGRPLASGSPTIRSVDCDPRGRLLLATGGGELLCLDPAAGELAMLLQGHGPAAAGTGWPGSVAGLACHPSRDVAASAADDGTLRLWSLKSHAMLAVRPLPAPARALAFSPDGATLAVGLSSGGLLVLDATTLGAADEPALARLGARGAPPPPLTASAASEAELPRGGVSDLCWSPDGSLLAAAATDARIHLYAPVAPASGWAGGITRVGVCAGHAAAVLQLDWSAEPVLLAPAAGSAGAAASARADAAEVWLLRSCCAAGDLAHWELQANRSLPADGAADGAVRAVLTRRVERAEACRDVAWATETCGRAWGASALAALEGVAAAGVPPAVERSHEGEVLAAAHARGGVALWRWPAAAEGAPAKTYGGHAAPAERVRWSHDDGLLLTAGGEDMTLLQWRHAFGDDAGGALTAGPDDDVYDSDVARDLQPADAWRPLARRRGGLLPPAARRAFVEASSWAQAARAGGALPLPPVDSCAGLPAAAALLAVDEMVQQAALHALRPWRLGQVPPRGALGTPSLSEAPPLPRPILAWLHGVRAHDTRSALHHTARGELVYPAGALVVVLELHDDPAVAPDPARRMRFYTQHAAAVVALAVHPDGGTVASASVEPEPAVRVWDSGSMRDLAVLSGAHSAGVAAVAFSGVDGELLASVDLAHAPLLALWDWRRGTLLASARVGRQRVLGVAFAPNGGALVTFARRQVRFWSLDGGRLASRRALGGEGSAYTVLCCAFLPDGKTMLAGTATGELLLWQHGRCELVIRANRQQPIFAVHASNAGVFAAGRGGRLFCWLGVRSPPLRLSDALVIPLGSHLGGAADGAGRPLTMLRGEPPCVRSLSLRRDPAGGSGHGGRIRLGIATRGGELWEVTLPATVAEAAGRLPPPALLVQGHSPAAASGVGRKGGALDEAAALATHPQDADAFATGADDGTVRLWSVGARRMIAMRLLHSRVTALAFSSDGAHLAAAAGASLAVLFADSLIDAAAAVLDAPGDVTCLAFSPDDELLAGGNAHGDVHLLRPNQA